MIVLADESSLTGYTSVRSFYGHTSILKIEKTYRNRDAAETGYLIMVPLSCGSVSTQPIYSIYIVSIYYNFWKLRVLLLDYYLPCHKYLSGNILQIETFFPSSPNPPRFFKQTFLPHSGADIILS